MLKRSLKARIAHTKQKPKPRVVSKAHRLERDENEFAVNEAQRRIKRTEKKLK